MAGCLEPLRGLDGLEFVAIADDTVVAGSVEALYSLCSLGTLIITRKSGVDVGRILETAPCCEVRLTSR